MKIISILKQSVRSLLANKIRSFLTTLGIIIGIGSVIGLVSLGSGVQESISQRVGTLGSTNLTVLAGDIIPDEQTTNTPETGGSNPGSSAQPPRGGFSGTVQTLTKEDLIILKNLDKDSDLITGVSGSVSGSQIFEIKGKKQRRSIAGVTSSFFTINNRNLSAGELFTDGANEADVVVLGSKLAEDLFGSATKSVGKLIEISDSGFKVIGVLSEKEESGFTNPNNMAYIPAETALKEFDTEYFNSFTVQTSSEDEVDEAKQLIETALMKSHGISDKSLADFSVVSAKDLLSTIEQITGILTAFLAGIAGISLLVGGIGIMNIMLVAVTERTKEIGLRKALGATTADIMLQFIVEAVMLTVIGGLLGVAFGYAIGFSVSLAVPDITPIVSLDTLLLAVGVSSLIGIIFGVYPAAKASRLNPIDALRYE